MHVKNWEDYKTIVRNVGKRASRWTGNGAELRIIVHINTDNYLKLIYNMI